MNDTEQIAKHLRDLHFGGNWTAVSLKDKLDGVTWQQATTAVGAHHTIAVLVFHMNFFVEATIKGDVVTRVLKTTVEGAVQLVCVDRDNKLVRLPAHVVEGIDAYAD